VGADSPHKMYLVHQSYPYQIAKSFFVSSSPNFPTLPVMMTGVLFGEGHECLL